MPVVGFGFDVYLPVSQEESAVERALDVLHAGRDVEPFGHFLTIFREEAVNVSQRNDEDAEQGHQHAASQYGRQQLNGPSGEVYVIPHILSSFEVPRR